MFILENSLMDLFYIKLHKICLFFRELKPNNFLRQEKSTQVLDANSKKFKFAINFLVTYYRLYLTI